MKGLYMHSIEGIVQDNKDTLVSSSGSRCTCYESVMGAKGVYKESAKVPKWIVTSNGTDHYVHEVNQSVLQEYLFTLADKGEAEQLAELLNALCHA